MKQLVADSNSIKIMVDGETVEEFSCKFPQPHFVGIDYEEVGLLMASHKGVAFWNLMVFGAKSKTVEEAEEAGLTHSEIMHALSLYGGA